MRNAALTTLLLLVACSGASPGVPGAGDDLFVPNRNAQCQPDPDCGLDGRPCANDCPDFWDCTTAASGGKVCTNPGPQVPSVGSDWTCSDQGEFTVCNTPGNQVSSAGSDWNCALQGEFTVCRNDPAFPPSAQLPAGGGDWECRFVDEFRVCVALPPGGGTGAWDCTQDATNAVVCRNDDYATPPAVPGAGGEWTCELQAEFVTCTTPGGTVPPATGAGSDWTCTTSGEFVTCRSNDYPLPPAPSNGGEYDCTFGREFAECRANPPGTVDPTGPTVPPHTGGVGGYCPTAGATRWCDDATYCSWGQQVCGANNRWGACAEPASNASGVTQRPNNTCAQRYFYFNYACCEDQADRDGDGYADCLVPSNNMPAAVQTDGSLCSYCDPTADNPCGGRSDALCVMASPGNQPGYMFCAADCGTSGCPSGYACRGVNTAGTTRQMCVPSAGHCGDFPFR